MTYWAASEIVLTPELKHRTAVLCHLLQLSDHLLELRDYFAVMAIYLGLSLNAIDRLKQTWKVIFCFD